MMFENVSYVQNYSDVACKQAVQSMVLLAFGKASEAGGVMAEELDQMNQAQPKKWTSDLTGICGMVETGISTFHGTDLDITAIAENSYKAYKLQCGDAIAKKYQVRLNLAVDQQAAQKLLTYQDPLYERIKVPSIKDVVALIAQGALVNIWVNAKALRGEDGFAGHFVLAHHTDGSHITVHDPFIYQAQDASRFKNNRLRIDDLDNAMRYTETQRIGGYVAYKLP